MKLLLIIFLCVLYPLSSFAQIDERKTDVYFANGILTDDRNATANTLLLRDSIRIKFYNDNPTEMKKRIGKVAKAYNSTHGMIADLYESLKQKLSDPDDFNPQEYLPEYLQDAHTRDLGRQVTSYKNSIKDGHKVLVVAHSQGNLFTYEAYRKIDDWMQDYFEAVSIASPGHELIKEGTPRISWHNDLVGHIGLYDDFITNPVRITKWVPLRDSTTPPFESPMHTYDFQVPTDTFNDWIHTDFKYDSNVHAFTFYMGEELRENGGDFILNTLTHETLKTNVAKDEIMAEIEKKLTILDNVKSQWKFKESATCKVSGCENKLREVEHEFDTSLDYLLGGSLVYPFKENGKIYPVTGHGFVKASYGGVGIEEPSDNQDVCYELKDENDATIEAIQACKICQAPAIFEILSHENVNTKEWRVTVKNKETNETTIGVYPFNLEGSLYQLPSGEWVLANCGGIAIESSWSGQQSNEVYRLKGTDEVIEAISIISYAGSGEVSSKIGRADEGATAPIPFSQIHGRVSINYKDDFTNMEEYYASFVSSCGGWIYGIYEDIITIAFAYEFGVDTESVSYSSNAITLNAIYPHNGTKSCVTLITGSADIIFQEAYDNVEHDKILITSWNSGGNFYAYIIKKFNGSVKFYAFKILSSSDDYETLKQQVLNKEVGIINNADIIY